MKKKFKKSNKKISKKEKNVDEAEQEKFIKSVPRCLVFKKQKKAIGKLLEGLIQDLRNVMSPYTAKNLKVEKKLKMKKLVSLCQEIYVSHFIIVGLAQNSPRLRILRVPGGPSVFLSIQSYSLIRDINIFYDQVNIKHNTNPQKFQTPALVVFKGFGDDSPEVINIDDDDEEEEEKPTPSKVPEWVKLSKVILESMFVNPEKIENYNVEKQAKRVVLFSYDANEELIHFRHYHIQMKEKDKNEDETEKKEKKTKKKDSKKKEKEEETEKKIQLSEIGPRMSLKVEKILKGFNDEGEVLYHCYKTKTEKEKREQQRKLNEKKKRKQIQDENVEKKKEKKREKKVRRKRKREEMEKQQSSSMMDEEKEENEEVEEIVDEEEKKRVKKKRKLN